MRAYSLKRVKEMVTRYNATKNADKVAEDMGLPLRDIRGILVWLHRHDSANAGAHKTGKEFLLKAPTNHVWVQWLYLHNIPAHAAAMCLNWPLERLLEMCGGPEEWAKHSDRKPIKLAENDIWSGREEQGRLPDDPTAEEIEARKLEVQAAWSNIRETKMRGGAPKEPPRVGIRQYAYDNGAFSEM